MHIQHVSFPWWKTEFFLSFRPWLHDHICFSRYPDPSSSSYLLLFLLPPQFPIFYTPGSVLLYSTTNTHTEIAITPGEKVQSSGHSYRQMGTYHNKESISENGIFGWFSCTLIVGAEFIVIDLVGLCRAFWEPDLYRARANTSPMWGWKQEYTIFTR